MSSARGRWSSAAMRCGELVRDALGRVLGGRPLSSFGRSGRHRGRGGRPEPRRTRPSRATGSGCGPIAQQPTCAPLHQAAAREVHARSARRRRPTLSSASMSRQSASWSNTARAVSWARTTSGPSAPVSSPMPEGERRAGPVDEPVHERGRGDLAAQGVRPDPFEEPAAHRGREGADQLGHEVGVVGQLRREQLFFERDLGVREQHRELGRVRDRARRCGGRRAARRSAGARRRGRGVRPILQRVHEAHVHAFHRDRLGAAVVEGAVLAVVVAQHERGDLVGHR